MFNLVQNNNPENILNKIINSGLFCQESQLDLDIKRHVIEISCNGRHYQHYTPQQFQHSDIVAIWKPVMESVKHIFKKVNATLGLFDKDGYAVSVFDESTIKIGARCNVINTELVLMQTTDVPIEVNVFYKYETDKELLIEERNNDLHLLWDCSGSNRNSIIVPVRDEGKELLGFVSAGIFGSMLTKELILTCFFAAQTLEYNYSKGWLLKKYSASLLDGFPMCAMLIDEHGHIVYANKQCQTLLGIEEPLFYVGNPIVIKSEYFQTVSSQNDFSSLKERFTIIIADKRNIPCVLLQQSIVHVPHNLNQMLVLFREEQKTITNIDQEIPDNITKDDAFKQIIGTSAAITHVKSLGKKAARTSSSVLIEGESGTGKELLAKAIYIESGRKGPFIPINCGALPRELLLSELFGHEEGAFTGSKKGGMQGKLEIADGGVLFLDEIGEMPFDMQVSLLRFLQDKTVTRIGNNTPKKVNVKILAATNKDLRVEIAQGKFREDLYYRLSTLIIKVPPLRQRKEDIQLIVVPTIKELCNEFNIRQPRIDQAVIDFLVNYDWPGNVRELHNVIENMLVVCEKEEILIDDLPPYLRQTKILRKIKSGTLESMEETIILDTLQRYGGNLSQSAKSLGISRPTLYRKMKNFNSRAAYLHSTDNNY